MGIWLDPFEEQMLSRCRIKNPHAYGTIRLLLEHAYQEALALRHTDGFFRLPHSYQQLLGYRDEYERYRYADAARRRIKQFLRHKHLEEERAGERLRKRLTADGAAEAIRIHILTKNERLPRGEICGISYDLPECQHYPRDLLRTFLKQIGCRMVHQSLWSTSRDIRAELRDLFAVRGAEGWIKIFSIK